MVEWCNGAWSWELHDSTTALLHHCDEKHRCCLHRMTYFRLLAASLVVWLGGVSQLPAQLPSARLLSVFPTGGRQGSTFEVTVSGQDLDEVDGLRFSHPGITASVVLTEPTLLRKLPRPVPGRFTVAVAAQVPPGPYDLRAIGRYGVSNPRAFVVGDRPEMVEQTPNQSPADANKVPLGTVVNGQADKDSADYFRFRAEKGQRILVDCWAQRIDSLMDATLVLYDAAGKELDHNRDHSHRDPLMDFTAPASGEYVLKVYDFLYGGGEEYFYRLVIGTGPHLDFIFPPAGEPGSKRKYLLYGRNLPGGTLSDLSIDGKRLEEKTVEIDLPADGETPEQATSLASLEPEQVVWGGIEYRLGSSQGVSNSLRVGFATAAVVIEEGPNDQPDQAQELQLPCEVSGRFFPSGDQDWFTFQAEKKSVYWIEVLSRRLGLQTDPSLLLQRVSIDSAGREQILDVAEVDDASPALGNRRYQSANHDPVFRFEAVEGGTYCIRVRDLYGGAGGSPSHLYRLSIRKGRPDFYLLALTQDRRDNALVASLWVPYLRKGESLALKVFAVRRDDFDGEISLEVEGLPPGISCGPARIPADRSVTDLVCETARDSSGGTSAIRIVGKAQLGGREVVREALWGSPLRAVADLRGDLFRSRLTPELILAVSEKETMPLLTGLEVETQEWKTSLAGKLDIPFKITGNSEFQGDILIRPVGIPGMWKADPISIGATGEGTLTLELPRPLTTRLKVVPGEYTFYLEGTTQIPYRNNPEAAQEARQEGKRIEYLASQLAVAAQKAAETGAGVESDGAAQSAAQAKASQKERIRAARRAKEAAEKAKLKKVSVAVYSAPQTLTITPAPIVLSLGTVPQRLKPGASVEISVGVERLYAYDDPVELRLIVPEDRMGIRSSPISIPKGESQAILLVEVTEEALPGEYRLTVQAQVELNGQDLEVEETISVQVEAFEKSS